MARVGATFVVRLPTAPDTAPGDEPEHPTLPPNAPVAVPHLRGVRVLVVDDEAPIREALVSTLEANGYQSA